jgi:tRNA dimethylallyltransferase
MKDLMWFDAINFVDSCMLPSKKNLISIVGLTATGKTNLALELASHLLDSNFGFSRIDLISADSRQVYSEIPIISGADVPPVFTLKSSKDFGVVKNQTKTNYKLNQRAKSDSKTTKKILESLTYPYFQNQDIYLHGLSILPATADWSVVHFLKFAQEIIKYSWSHNGCVILVGGTGLYHVHLFNHNLLRQPGPSPDLRLQTQFQTLESLQKQVQLLDLAKWNQMNLSDQNNSRRLIRVLEQAVFKHSDYSNQQRVKKSLILPDLHKIIYLTNELESVVKKISQRVEDRVNAGALLEVEALAKKYDFQKIPQINTATGVLELLAVKQGELSLDQAMQKWIQRERKYAKQQKTWWNTHQVDFVLDLSKK